VTKNPTPCTLEAPLVKSLTVSMINPFLVASPLYLLALRLPKIYEMLLTLGRLMTLQYKLLAIAKVLKLLGEEVGQYVFKIV
jgi:hypothetical protein